MSRIDPLLERLMATRADEICLEVGQRIYQVEAGSRSNVGREPLNAATLQIVAAELISPAELSRLDRQPRKVELVHGDTRFTAELTKKAGELRIAIRRSTVSEAAADRAADGAMPVGAYATAEHSRVRVPGPAARPIDELLQVMVAQQASDLHLSAENHPALRVHGNIRFLAERPVLSSGQIEGLVRPILSDKARQDFEQRHNADFAYEVTDLARFRVNIFVDRKGVGCVFRQIPIDIVSVEQLGLPKTIVDLCHLSKGLVLVTGPTGSGKSTTLAALVDYANKHRTDHIITVEDPIEFIHSNIKCLVNQREIGTHTDSFKDSLRAALREDPDIVLVGEMRDLETVSIALETAETGHLVFGTLHTTTAVSTVDRVIDQFPADQQAQIRVMLSDSLKAVIAQVLCRRIGGGRVAAMEVLLVNSAVSSLIREGKTFQIISVMQTSRGAGMVTMNDSLLALVKQKLIEPKEAWMRATDKVGLLNAFKGAGLPQSFT